MMQIFCKAPGTFMMTVNSAFLPDQYVRLACLSALCTAAISHAQTPIRISVQPGNYAAFAVHVASENDFWKQAGITPSLVRYPAGVPQIKGNADWDIGVTGAVPALIGAKDFKLITIAVADDQSRTNQLMGRKELVQRIRAERSVPKGSKIAVTLNSTADYAVQSCLALWGGRQKSDMVYQGATQPEAIAAGASGSAELVGLWAPNIYAMQEKHGFEPLCSAKDFGSGVYNVVVTNRDYAAKNPDMVAKYLAVMMRSVNWIKENPQKAQALFISVSSKENVQVSNSAAKGDYESRPLFNLDQQLVVMGDTPEKSNDSATGKSFYAINVFLTEGKAGSRNMRPASFVDASFLKRVKDNPELSKIAASN
jgi:ABC-type nitrate/sulfonate/bicarbonate transport system substrate-binding protein